MADETKVETPVEEPAPAPAAEEAAPAADAAAASTDELVEPARLSRPVRDRVLEAEAEIKAAIAVIEKKMSDITKKVKAESDNRGAADSPGATARTEMKRLKQAKDTLVRERQEIYAARDSAKANLDAKMNERRDLKSQTKFKSVEEIDKRIAELDQLQHTTSMPLKEEKKILKEIDELKKSKKLVAQFSAVGSSIDDQRRSAEDYQSQIAEKNAQLDAIKKQMDEHGAILKKLDDKKKDSATPGLLKEKDALREQKKEKQNEIQALWDGFKAENAKWKESQNEWKVYKAARDKAYEAEREKRRAEQKAAREAELAAKTPYEEEMDLCDYLVNYLTTSFMAEKKTEVVEEKVGDFSAFEGTAMVSKKGQDDDYLSLGGGKKKKGKAKKGPKGAKGGKIVLAIDTIETFSLLKISPPSTVDAVPAKVEELKAKKTYFEGLPRGEIESIAEINQKYEDKMDRRGGRGDREPRESKPKAGGKKAGKAAEFSLTDEFPSLPGAPKPVKAAEEEKGDEAAAAEEE